MLYTHNRAHPRSIIEPETFDISNLCLYSIDYQNSLVIGYLPINEHKCVSLRLIELFSCK